MILFTSAPAFTQACTQTDAAVGPGRDKRA